MENNKPTLKLVGKEGNAFAILGEANKVAKKAGWSQEKIDEMMTEARSGDYDNLLQTMMEYFVVELCMIRI